MKIWHKALHSQWSASDLPWKKPLGIRSPKLLDQMGKLLTPVLMGEQAALYSVSGLIPVLGKTSEVESQFYLTTWAVDEARHTELFTLFYHRLEREPLPIRRFPQGYLFQSAIVSDDPAEWLSGVLVSEVTAKKLMEEFRRVDIDPLLTDIADGILLDEARHLGFNHIYIEDKIKELTLADPDAADGLEAHLHRRIRNVHELLGPALDALHDEMKAIGIDRIELYDKVLDEASQRLQKSIDSGRRLASRAMDGNAATAVAEAVLAE